ncbi:hypothetical protein [Parasitella parasitica]|uniref:SH3 domain-containing protein n=1 Tax=Parasitella parasitica TaxID=35722 RepID=A0A0B7NU13_9FUNG|nr:hypothetical protein [Parasitella parasitica]
MSENDASINKEKKEKKDKKKDKKKKNRKTMDTLGNSVDPSTSSKSSDEYDSERFKSVPNPAFNPALATTPLSSPAASRNLSMIDSNGSNDENWTISSKSKDMPFIQANTGANATEKSPMTPAELQGYTAQKFVPTGSYTHLDPSKSENAYAAFNHLQKVVMANKEGNSSAQQRVVQQQPQQKNQPQQQPQTQPFQQHRPRSVAQQSPSTNKQPLSMTQPPLKQQPPLQQQQYQHRHSQQHIRANRLADGVPVVQYVRALWNYTAQIPTELSFNAKDHFAVLNQQPDGWWYAELLDPSRRKRGLIPGNYMTPV